MPRDCRSGKWLNILVIGVDRLPITPSCAHVPTKDRPWLPEPGEIAFAQFDLGIMNVGLLIEVMCVIISGASCRYQGVATLASPRISTLHENFMISCAPNISIFPFQDSHKVICFTHENRTAQFPVKDCLYMGTFSRSKRMCKWLFSCQVTIWQIWRVPRSNPPKTNRATTRPSLLPSNPLYSCEPAFYIRGFESGQLSLFFGVYSSVKTNLLVSSFRILTRKICFKLSIEKYSLYTIRDSSDAKGPLFLNICSTNRAPGATIPSQ